MNKLNFIFTKSSFYIDDTSNDSSKWSSQFQKDKYSALYEFGFENDLKGLTSSAFYLYRLSQKFIETLRNAPELEIAREEVKVIASDEDIEYLLSILPFAIGTEFVDSLWIQNIYQHLNEQFHTDIKSYKGTVQMYLEEKSQNLKVAQRIYFHLVENEEDSDFPFAFLATYATKDTENRIVHMPLKHALVEYKSDQEQLLNLLAHHQ